MASKIITIGGGDGGGGTIDDITGLRQALDDRELLANKKTDLSSNSDTFYPSVKAVNIALASIDPTSIGFVTKSTLTINLNDGKNFFVTLSADATFSLSNIVDEKIYNFHIASSSGLITITLPNTANDKVTAVSVAVRATGASRVISMYKYGSNRYWFTSEEMS